MTITVSILIMALSFSSCSFVDDLEDALNDVRDQAFGSYSGSAISFVKNENDEWVKLDESSINFSIDDGGEITGLAIKDGDEKFLELYEITEASNGFAFNISRRTFEEDGTVWTLTGYDSAELDGKMYHGRYDNNENTIYAAYTLTTNDEEIGTIEILMNITATKK
ncbi:MAG: hypothetical protein GXO47_03575 [Chlorobi bacterium]|nr:hypothetical protein [Chlorobiota bacterium]